MNTFLVDLHGLQDLKTGSILGFDSIVIRLATLVVLMQVVGDCRLNRLLTSSKPDLV